MMEAHNSAYIVHPKGTKIYRDLKENFWWSGMKKKSSICGPMFDLSTDGS